MFGWLRRRKRGPVRIGLALGGGAVRGAAHVGVLSVLEREGLRPDLVAGTSVGATVGAAYAAGLPVEDIASAMRGLSWKDITDLSLRRSLSVFDTTPLRRFVDGAIGGAEFSDLRLPLAVVACDVLTGERIVLREGSVARAALASAAVPASSRPTTPVSDCWWTAVSWTTCRSTWPAIWAPTS